MIQPNILVRIQPRLTQNYTYIVPTYPWEKLLISYSINLPSFTYRIRWIFGYLSKQLVKKINNSKANDEQSTSSYLTKADPVHIHHQYGESPILSKDIDLTKITKVLSVHRTKITKVLSNQPVGKGRPALRAQLERMSDLRSRSPGLRGTKTGACCGRKCAGSSLFKPNSIYHNNIIIYICIRTSCMYAHVSIWSMSICKCKRMQIHNQVMEMWARIVQIKQAEWGLSPNMGVPANWSLASSSNKKMNRQT